MGHVDLTNRERRVTLNLPARLIDSTSTEIQVVVLDLSPSGIRLQISEPLFVGETVAVELGRSGFAKVQILWVAGNQAGGTFVDIDVSRGMQL
nr:PilZ domain-containing protein [uncultured Sphingomonas sp.]